MPRREKPIDMTRGPVAMFAARLRALRHAAGTPTYRDLAVRANYSVTVLSQAAAGDALPQWSVVKAFVLACDGDLAQWEQDWLHTRRDQQVHDVATATPVHRENEEPELFRSVRTEQRRRAEDPPAAAESDVLTVFLLDDHELVRDGIRALAERTPDIKVIGEAATVAEALARIPTLKPDLAILDVRLPDGTGIEVCHAIQQSMSPPPACLMLTSYSDDDALFASIAAGAAGFLLKQVSAANLLQAIRTVGAGGSLVDTELVNSVMARLRKGDRRDDLAYLTQQEKRVLNLVAEGLTNRQIATRLHLSEKTVRNYVSNVIRKMGVWSRTEAAVRVARAETGGR